MASLNDLFPDGPRQSPDERVVLDEHHTRQRFEQLFGPRREPQGGASSVSDAGALARMVEEAADDKAPLDLSAFTPPTTGARRRRRVDAILIAACGLALLSVGAAATVGGIQLATASPATSALQSLQADEAALQNAFQAVESATHRLSAEIETVTAEATTVRQSIVATATAPNPFVEIDAAAQPLQVAEPAAVAAVLAGVDAYIAGLATIVVPDLPVEYERGTLDEDSLNEVAAAIDAAQAELAAIDGAMSEVRTVRTQVQTLRAPYVQALLSFASTFPAAAATLLAEFPDAAEGLRAAVSTTAGQVAASDLTTPGGAATLTHYRDAAVALAADQLRVEKERIDEERRQQNNSNRSPSSQPEAPAPTDPAPPVDPPADPEPPVDPGTPPDGSGTP